MSFIKCRLLSILLLTAAAPRRHFVFRVSNSGAIERQIDFCKVEPIDVVSTLNSSNNLILLSLYYPGYGLHMIHSDNISLLFENQLSS
jgi:hypothetical protein